LRIRKKAYLCCPKVKKYYNHLNSRS
jgi:hypothetical protein